jgi:hypothetical protein
MLIDVTILKNFLEKLILALENTHDQADIRLILHNLDNTQINGRDKFILKINRIFLKYQFIQLSPDDALAIQNIEQLNVLHERAFLCKQLYELKPEWNLILSHK